MKIETANKTILFYPSAQIITHKIRGLLGCVCVKRKWDGRRGGIFREDPICHKQNKSLFVNVSHFLFIPST